MVDANNNVVEYLKYAAEKNPDRPALIMKAADGGTVSYGSLWKRIGAFSSGMEQAGLKAGERAICMVPMSHDLYVCLLGLLKMGAVTVFVDPWIGTRQIAAFAGHASPDAFIGIPKSHLLRYMDKRLRAIKISVTTGSSFFGIPARYSMSGLESAGFDSAIFSSGKEEPALITFTSGSSGEPKGANRTHGFLSAQHTALRGEFSYEENDIDMPMFPVFALNNLALGITSVVPDMDFRSVAAVDPEVIVAQMKQHRVTTSTASPPFFDRIAEYLITNPQEKLSLRRILTGGAPVSDRQLMRWHEAFGDTEIAVVYGSTEAEPVAHIGSRERIKAVNKVRPLYPGFCVGRPAECVTTKVIKIHNGPIDLSNRGWEEWEVAPGEAGELLVTGDHVCKDYYKNPDAVKENKISGPDGRIWHRMGDTGYFDEEGRFWIVGRTHSTIWRGGEPVHPQIVEQAVSEGNNWQVAAVGSSDDKLGEKVTVVISPGSSVVDKDSVVERLSEAGIAVDDIVIRTEPLPVDPRHNSKIDYGVLREELSKEQE